MSEAASGDGHWAVVDAVVKAQDRDRWLASLFVPAVRRRDVHALIAFSSEIARVREVVHEPMPGEIRFQWWRDALTGLAGADAAAHPIARAVLATIAAHRLPLKPFLDLLEARTFDLYDDPMPTLGDLEGYCGETQSALFQLTALVLADGENLGTHDAAGHAGVAYALTGLLRALPFHARRGQCYLPLDMLARNGASREDVVLGKATPGLLATLGDLRGEARRHLARARELVAAVPPATKPAFLPLALVEPYLAAMERPGYAPFERVVELPQWRRQWALWRAARR